MMCDFVGEIIDLEKLPPPQKKRFAAFFKMRQRELEREISALNKRIKRLDRVRNLVEAK
jgi:hypothetical protein